jgi:hypothetical protein
VIPSTIFKMCYDRGDLPIVIDFIGAHRKVKIKGFNDLDCMESGCGSS